MNFITYRGNQIEVYNLLKKKILQEILVAFK